MFRYGFQAPMAYALGHRRPPTNHLRCIKPDGSLSRYFFSPYGTLAGSEQTPSNLAGGMLSSSLVSSSDRVKYVVDAHDIRMLDSCSWLVMEDLNDPGYLDANGDWYAPGGYYAPWAHGQRIADWIASGGRLIVPLMSFWFGALPNQLSQGWDNYSPQEVRQLFVAWLNGPHLDSLSDAIGVNLPPIFRDPPQFTAYSGNSTAQNGAAYDSTVFPELLTTEFVYVFTSALAPTLSDNLQPIATAKITNQYFGVPAGETPVAGVLAGWLPHGEGRIIFHVMLPVYRFQPLVPEWNLLYHVLIDLWDRCWQIPDLDDRTGWIKQFGLESLVT